MAHDTCTAIVLGLSPTGLYAIRELGQAGYRILGVGTSRQAGAFSRYLVGTVLHPDPQARIAALLERFDPVPQEARKPLIVTSDQDLAAVCANANALAERFVLQPSYTDGLAELIMDKDAFYGLCETHGVAHPHVWRAKAGTSEALVLRDAITYPTMVKPALIHAVKHMMHGQKGWVLKTRNDFDRIVPTLPREAGMLLFQEIVPGSESEITLWCGYIDLQGIVRQRFTARKLRQYPPGFGSASLVQSHPEPETIEVAETFLMTLGYRGIGAVEFKRHPKDGKLRIIEVNPRPSLWFSVSTAAGVTVTATAVADMTNRPMPNMTAQRDGIRWRYGAKDMASINFYRRTPDFVLPPPRTEATGPAIAHTKAVFDPADPMPLVGESWTVLTKGLSRLRARVSKK